MEVKMYLFRVQELAKFLMRPGVTNPEVCKFLVLETFAPWKPAAFFAAEITEDGYLAAVGSFGLNPKTIQAWGNIPLTQDLPLTEAVKTNSFLVVKPTKVFEDFPLLKNYSDIPEDWDSHLICPVLPFGVFSLTLQSVPEVDSEFESFARTAGSLVALHFTKANLKIETFSRKKTVSDQKRSGELTERQLIIKALMEKGYTNAAIAAEIEYSESLVRQETMMIYSTLNVSGRKDLLGNSAG
jgi:DNA-binding CsgD family transcriptional regulator